MRYSNGHQDPEMSTSRAARIRTAPWLADCRFLRCCCCWMVEGVFTGNLGHFDLETRTFIHHLASFLVFDGGNSLVEHVADESILDHQSLPWF